MDKDTRTPPPANIPRIESHRLLGAGGQLWIQHAGQWYLLRTTAANKLILTK
ncbi:hemin uptake protein HemP [Guyparkeria sp.]|uniref:hemin uptake protein HemP n=1 Tax=Guyparkeria sp. TaxID=2035736 RepID=UPI00356A06B5